MCEKCEKSFHRFVLVNFVAVETFQQIIVAIVVVVVFADGFVGIEKPFAAEATSHWVVEPLEDLKENL